MGAGPITIFDKSALQSLSMDESVWLDAFFLVNVVPMFYVETLADLEKEVAQGKTPEDLVGMLAVKTPPGAAPNVHHRALILGELMGHSVPMDGRVLIGGGDLRRTPDGATGLHVDQFDEAIALDRWKDHDFLQIERNIAKTWRLELVNDERDRTIALLRNALPRDVRIPNLGALKELSDDLCSSAEKQVLILVLEILGVPQSSVRAAVARWEDAGRPTLETFAPYTAHVFKVDFLYYLGIDRSFISGSRPSNKADMAYLYYLPFSMLFTSGDNLHRRTAPLFLRPDQSFVDAASFKQALKEIDEHYDRLPDEIKTLGVMTFAHYPPAELDNLVTKLWDKHMRPDWREGAKPPDRILREWAARKNERHVRGFRGLVEGARPLADGEAHSGTNEMDYVVIGRQMPVRKGKWRLVPEQMEKDEEEGG